MNEENALVTNLKADQMNMTIYAKTANASDDLVVLEKGAIKSILHLIFFVQLVFHFVSIFVVIVVFIIYSPFFPDAPNKIAVS